MSRQFRMTGPLPRRKVKIANIGQLLTCAGSDRGPLPHWRDLGCIEGAEMVVRHGLEGGWQVAWMGRKGDGDAPPADSTVDLGGRTLLPGLVDCHTHLVFAGDRAEEFGRRLAGETYQQIAAAGGGIQRTVQATRAASVPQLVDAAAARLQRMADQGARVVEIKSGYGLDLATELKILATVAHLQQRFAGQLEIVATAMPAHAVAPEFKGDPAGYVDLVCREILPALAAHPCHPQFADVFVEDGYFSVAQADKVWRAAQKLGLQLKAHVDEFAAIGGLPWALQAGATSVEHLLQTDAAGIAALAKSQTVAVGLPLTSVFLREPLAPLRALIDGGALLALGTDCNPGSAHTTSLTLLLQLAVLLGRLTPAEAIRAVTRGGALALGCPNGYTGRFAVDEPFVATVLEMPRIDDLFYHFGEPAQAWPGLQEAGVA